MVLSSGQDVRIGGLQQQLKALVGESSRPLVFGELLHFGQLMTDLHLWCKRVLREAHLVEVAAALNNTLEISMEELALLELPTDILRDFPDWELGSRARFAPPPLALNLPRLGGSDPIGLVRMQLSPFSATLSAALLLLKHMLFLAGGSIRFQVAVEPGGNLDTLAEVIFDFDPTARERVVLYELQSASVFAQDNGRGALTGLGQPALLIPRGFRQERGRGREALDTQVRQELGGIQVHRSRLYWEGGNVLNDDLICLIGMDHVRENMLRFGLTAEEVKLLFRSEFGDKIAFLGDLDAATFDLSEQRALETGQASFHLDLDVALLGTINARKPPVALVAAPNETLPLIDKVLRNRELTKEHFLDEQASRQVIGLGYRRYAEERAVKLESYSRVLTELGYEIIPVPDLRIDPNRNLFSTRNLDFVYCNVMPGLIKGRPSVVYLKYGIPALDHRAEQAYREAGCSPVPVTNSGRLANLLMLFRGGLRCACSQIC